MTSTVSSRRHKLQQLTDLRKTAKLLQRPVQKA